VTSEAVDVSVAKVRRAIDLVRSDDSGLCWFAGERSPELVLDAERALGQELPESYRLFVSELGAGSVGSEEIYGVTTTNFESSSVPNGIWMTLVARREWRLPEHLLVIYFDGGVDYYVIDGGAEDSPVMVWRPGVSSANGDLSVASPTFGDFFLGIVEVELGRA
jgi:antitoxin YobK